MRSYYVSDNELFKVLGERGYTFTGIKLGEGAYAPVYECTNSAGQTVAVKYRKNFYASLVEAKRCVREMYLLRMLNHPNVNSLLDVIKISDKAVCLVLKHKNFSLNNKHGLTEAEFVSYLHQMLNGLNYLKEANVMHRDLNSDNIFISSDGSLELGDFGLSRSPKSLEEKADIEVVPILNGRESKEVKPRRKLTAYVVTRWYRAPEIIMAHLGVATDKDPYDHSSDMWSLGCVLFEMLCRLGNKSPRDIQGYSSHDQLVKIFRLVGWNVASVPKEFHEHIKGRYGFSYTMDDNRPGSLDQWATQIKASTSFLNSAIDLLKQLLQIDPSKRPTPAQALAHPLFKKHRSLEQELKTHGQNPSFTSQLREKNGKLSLTGICVAWLHQLENQENVSEEMLRKYVDKMCQTFEKGFKVETQLVASLKPLGKSLPLSIFKPAISPHAGPGPGPVQAETKGPEIKAAPAPAAMMAQAPTAVAAPAPAAVTAQAPTAVAAPAPAAVTAQAPAVVAAPAPAAVMAQAPAAQEVPIPAEVELSIRFANA